MIAGEASILTVTSSIASIGNYFSMVHSLDVYDYCITRSRLSASLILGVCVARHSSARRMSISRCCLFPVGLCPFLPVYVALNMMCVFRLNNLSNSSIEQMRVHHPNADEPFSC
jgi:hypothetical protein